MKTKLLSFLVVLIVSVSCGEQTTNSTDDTPAPITGQTEFLTDLPALTGEEFNWFVVNCTSIDYIMTTPDFSMSVNGQQDVRGDLGGISQNPVRRPPMCKSIGMIFYKSGADRMFEADLFADSLCQYIIFKKDNQELYANALTAEGYQRFVNVLHQIKSMNQAQ